MPDAHAPSPQWLEYSYRKAHPALRLPTKLAEWIGENLQEQLGFPDKIDHGAEPGSGWTPAELNHILNAHVVDGTFDYIWMCGMGVTAVQGYNASQMLSLQPAQKTITFLQPQG